MREFLFQPIQPDGRHGEPVRLAFADPEAAIRHALSAFPIGCELWDDYRLIGRFVGPAPAAVQRPPKEEESAYGDRQQSLCQP